MTLRRSAVPAILLFLLSRTAVAQPNEPTFTLEVDSDAPAVSFDEIAPRMSADLGAPVFKPGGRSASVVVSVRYRSASHELVVRAGRTDGRVVERAVVVKEGEEPGTAALLAGNLARDEAGELLDGFAARRRPPDAPAPPSPAPAPAPATPVAPARDAVEPNVYASAGLAYPIATNWGSPNAETYFDFSLLYGRVGTVHGLQLSSFGSWASREVEGVQLTAFGGYARRMSGTQISGGFVTAGELRGVQAAPVNVAREATGLQLGVVNVAKKVNGLQLGVVNVAEEVDGTALGVVSISKNSVHPIAYASNLAYSNAGIKFQTGYVYTLFALTYGNLETDFDNLATTGALGGHIPLDVLLEKLDIEPEANIVHVLPRKGSEIDDNLWLGGRVTMGYSFAKHLRVFAGGGARFPLFVNIGRDVVRPELIAGVQL